MVKYRIRERKFSSNIIEICNNPDDKKPTWIPFIGCFLLKEYGDDAIQIIHQVFKNKGNNGK